ncbi:MAG: short-chain dehydrogenase [Candidatus Methylumidiphilus alinenensis]|uniref:Short-chain dehydrogenase n=1 Tax=Candidatus Methylumidiphilus alinenensis TaxID=2202197 RepID=A0A2W4RC97_9GAMM|nr:MAG: short-chain dehydrogenase [Candidatus Methylumidiphilus alinenensis]
MNTHQTHDDSATKRALLAIKQLQAKLGVLEQARSEPIAIIGMSCRFPGGGNDPELFWSSLRDGVDATVDIPKERWDCDVYHDPDPEAAGCMYVRRASLIDRVDGFDADFFGISPREAEMLDPQQRLLLEVSWEAIERAAISPLLLHNSQTGIFIGSEHHDYLHEAFYPLSEANVYTGTGNMPSMDSGRLAYFLGTQGPTLTVDTACSASLVALHLAVQSLRVAECELALVGGANLILVPHMSIIGSRARALAPDGRSKAFAAAADGYGRGEGCGVLVLKRLADAVNNHDQILAVIRGSAVNHDGRSSGLTVPNGVSQQKLIRQALANGKLTPGEIGYIEAHGTGTVLGDPIEVDALHAVFGERTEPLVLGSVKTNIGHLEAAAGVAGVIKTVLALQHAQIPPHLHFTEPNPHVAWDQLSMVVPTTLRPWPRLKKRIAGISSFSLSGTNAHVIIEEAPAMPARPAAIEPPLYLLTLSAKTETALRALAQHYAECLDKRQQTAADRGDGWCLGDICFTTHQGRAHFAHRLGVAAATLGQAQARLEAFVRGEMPLGIVQGDVSAPTPPKIAFLFTGQGSQYVGMGKRLYETQPIFRQALDRCGELLAPLLGQSLTALMFGEGQGETALEETCHTQPALFALEYALAQVWLSWGIRPDVMIGHSVGEYVAACLAGIFSLDDGIKLIAARGRLMQALPRDGAMVAVGADEQRVAAAVAPFLGEVAIAAVNGPQNTVISGKAGRIQAIAADFQSSGFKATLLAVSHAFHSPLMEPMLEEFAEVARTVHYAPPQIELISNLTGEPASDDIATPGYWCRHIREPVRFAAGMQTLRRQGCAVFIETGPKPVLLGMGRQCLEPGVPSENPLLWLPSLNKAQDDWQTMFGALAHLYAHGVAIDWARVDAGQDYRRVILPTYPFQRRSHWIKRHAQGYKESNTGELHTPLIGLLHKGDTQQLTALLRHSGQFSEQQHTLLPQLAEALIRQQQRHVAEQSGMGSQDMAERVYEVEWRVMQRQERSLPLLPSGAWLILADPTGVGAALATLLREQRQDCHLAYAGENWNQQNGVWILNPAKPDDFQRLLAEIALVGPLQGVIHLWSLDAATADALTDSELQAAQCLVCASTLHLLQALRQRMLQPRLWFATRGAVAVVNAATGVAQSSLWGLARVVALETPQLWGGILDLDPETAFADAESCMDAAGILLTELWDAQGEDQLAFRAGQRYVARLVHSTVDFALPQAQAVCADATYLITGGLGALGLQVAEWLIGQGARHLVLTGRSGLEGRREVIEPLLRDADIQVRKADMANAEDVGMLLEEINATMPPLRGIIHAAGVLDDGILLQQTWAQFQRVMAPKVAGSWNLYRQTCLLALDFFVLFSSGASLLGSAGQGSYAAANAFMDGLAAYGRRQGVPAVSICWGSWANSGMGVRGNSQGERLLEPVMGMRILQRVLSALATRSIAACVGVIDMDWPAFADALQTSSPFLSMLVQAPTAAPLSFMPRLRDAPPHERIDLLRNHLKIEVARVLGAQELPAARRGFFDMGMDSLMALQLSNRLQSSLGIVLPSTLVFEYPSVEALTDYLLEQMPAFDELPTPGIQAVAAASGRDDELAAIRQMSEAELEALIDQEIAEFTGASQ